LADGKNWHIDTNLLALQRETYSYYEQNSGKPTPTIPIEMEKPHILAYGIETGFLQYKEQVSFKCKEKIPAVQCQRKNLRLIQFLTVSFC
jgi:hypothetical protein